MIQARILRPVMKSWWYADLGFGAKYSHCVLTVLIAPAYLAASVRPIDNQNATLASRVCGRGVADSRRAESTSARPSISDLVRFSVTQTRKQSSSCGYHWPSGMPAI